MKTAIATYEIGLLYWWAFRDFLDQAKFLGYNISYRESSGWFFRTFTIRGPEADLRKIVDVLKQYEAD